MPRRSSTAGSRVLGAAGDIRGGLLHFDCPAGIAGDMAVAALVDLGVPEEEVRSALAALPLSGCRIEFARVKRGALVGLKFRVETEPSVPPSAHEEDRRQHAPDHDARTADREDEARRAPSGDPGRDEHTRHGTRHQANALARHREHRHSAGAVEGRAHPHRTYGGIRAMLVGAPLPDGVRRRALDIFDRIARVEGKLHGVPVDEVAFHEVGAIDSIADVVATAAALEWLRPARVTSRPVPLGHGAVQTAHGLLPVPAPATLELLAGARVEDGGAPFELTTPTGAAILAASAVSYGPLPEMRVAGVGWGAGDRELPDRPNLLRAIAGRPADEMAGERCLVVEANVDDMSPELLAPLIGDLIEAGARDAWIAPVLMKKGRPAHIVSALVDPGRLATVEAVLFRGSTTIGLRRHPVERTVAPRRVVEVDTPFGRVPVKVAGSGEAENVAPELDACLRIARERRVPLKRVYAEALAAFYRR